MILVTGGAGYIGSHMVLALLDAGLQPVVIDNLSTGFRQAVPDGVPFVKADIGDAVALDQLFAAHAVETVIHFAAFSNVAESVADPAKYYVNNVDQMQVLLDASRHHGVSDFIFSSTASVYGETDGGLVSETAPTAPISAYGGSKLQGEQMLAQAAQNGLRYGVLRYFNVAGADPRGRAGERSQPATHLIKIACEAAVGKRQGMAIFGTDYPTPDGTCVRDYIHVTDLAAAHLDLMRHMQAGHSGLVMNCGYGRGASVREVIAAVEACSDHTLNVAVSDRRPGDPAMLVADVSRIRATLPWEPRHDDLQTIVATALSFERRLSADASRPRV